MKFSEWIERKYAIPDDPLPMSAEPEEVAIVAIGAGVHGGGCGCSPQSFEVAKLATKLVRDERVANVIFFSGGYRIRGGIP